MGLSTWFRVPPFICLQRYTIFFEKTNKITTKYQNLELSDPWRPYMACCPWWNFDFWRKRGFSRLLGHSRGTYLLYIGVLCRSCPALPWFGVLLDSRRDHPERSREITPRECTREPAPPEDRTGQDTTTLHHTTPPTPPATTDHPRDAPKVI